MDIVYRWINEGVVYKQMMLACAVSPAQKSPCGLLHMVRRTEERKQLSCADRDGGLGTHQGCR